MLAFPGDRAYLLVPAFPCTVSTGLEIASSCKGSRKKLHRRAFRQKLSWDRLQGIRGLLLAAAEGRAGPSLFLYAALWDLQSFLVQPSRYIDVPAGGSPALLI